ncbi:MAG: putative membrane-bound dehydrogenase-like protein [Verrucomicrobiales bacterium]|jgi:putative membrane-bound dehydrogenase-like protein
MHQVSIQRIPSIAVLICVLIFGCRSIAFADIQCGAAKVDISPRQFPVIQNGGFLEALIQRSVDPLHARALVFDDGTDKVAIVVVDSCMIPRDLCDQAKALAHEQTGIPIDRILISATHTHAAPSVMDYCLGTRKDPAYTAFLPGKIVEAIQLAHSRLQPARVGFAVADAGEFTKNRRWIRRSDKLDTDPFGERSVQAMMHPGYQNPEFIGPSGPIDPDLSLLSIRTHDGKPLALLANFSMHYFSGHPGASADYYGRFAGEMQQRLAPDDSNFVAIMSQGTSGDLWWGDYSLPEKRQWTIDEYTAKLATLAEAALDGIEHQSKLDLAMEESRMSLGRRLPNEARLKWADAKLEEMGDLRPRNRPEVYAEQARWIHDNPTEEIVLQALKIGDVAITGIPNEVYAITGLKLKARSPFARTFNMSLANGAAGYIPPPEQHALGGYTTWPARTAGLEVEAEPKIVENLVQMMMQLAGRPYAEGAPVPGLAEPVHDLSLASETIFTLDMAGLGVVEDKLRPWGAFPAVYSGNLAFAVEGIPRPRVKSSYAMQFAGGKVIRGETKDGAIWKGKFESANTTVEMWFWSGLPGDARDITGYLFSHGSHALGISGTAAVAPNRLFFANELGRTEIVPRQWNHVMLTCDSTGSVHIYLNGGQKPEITTRRPLTMTSDLPFTIGADRDDAANFEGRIDEVSVFSKVFSPEDVAARFQSFGIEAPKSLSANAANAASDKTATELEDQPLSPAESIAATHVPEEFVIELVAAEPEVADPVAIDWGADGKLWVAEMADYPYGMDGEGKPGGRVRYLEDTDGDGRYEKSTVFVDGLSFPTSVMAWRDGVLITAAPDLLFANDPDGDGIAQLNVLFSGFVQGNQQLRVNSLRWGLDGWIYCASGGHHVGFGSDTMITNAAGETVALGSRDFRFRPDTGELDPQSGPSQFGRVRDDFGNWFGVQNSWPLWHYVLADHHLRRNPAFAAPDPRVQVRAPGNPRVFPNKAIQKRFHSYEQAGRYTSACGPSIYRDDLLFPVIPMTAFTCEPFHNLVQRHRVLREGVSFNGKRADDGELDFFASKDRWCRPVMSRTGPDGALYIVDMYRYMIEHPDWLPPNGREELKAFYRAGEDRGRIYRIRKKNQPLRKLDFADKQGIDHWLNMLKSPNGIVRDLAHRALLEENLSADQVAALTEIARSHLGTKSRIQALNALAGKSQVSVELLLTISRDRSADLRRHAASIAESLVVAEGEPSVAGILVALSEDPVPSVQLQAIHSLGNVEGAAAAAGLVAAARRSASAPMHTKAFLRAAVMTSAPRHVQVMAAAIEDLPLPMYSKPLFALAWGQSAMVPLLNAMRAESTRGLEIAADYFETEDERGVAPVNADADVRHKLEALEKEIVPLVLARAAEIVPDGALSADRRLAAMPLIGRTSVTRARGLQILQAVFQNSAENEMLRLAALDRLFSIDGNDVSGTVLSHYDQLTPRLRVAVIERALRRQGSTEALLQSVSAGTIPAVSIPTAQRQQLLSSDVPDVRNLAEQCFRSPVQTSHDELIATQTRAIEGLKDQGTGADVYQQRCAVCHSTEDGASKLGPDLRSITDRSTNGLLTAIIDPSRSVDPSYVGVTATLKNGETYYGRVYSETGASYRLMLLDGSMKGISRDLLKEIKLTPFSLMPEGLATDLDSQQLADLLAYVAGLAEAEK